MKHRLSRRDAAKILLATPVALAAGPLACQTTGSSGASGERLTPEQQQQKQELARSISRLEANVQKLDAMEIPIGAEPAIYFAPLLPKK